MISLVYIGLSQVDVAHRNARVSSSAGKHKIQHIKHIIVETTYEVDINPPKTEIGGCMASAS